MEETNWNITMEYTDVFHYALHVNGVPFLKKIQVENRTGEDLEGAVLRITFSDDLLKERMLEVPPVPAGAIMELSGVEMRLSEDALFQRTEQSPFTLEATLMKGDVSLAQASFPFTLLSYNQWLGVEKMPELLAAYVTPNHPEVDRILVQASAILEEMGADPRLTGYQDRDRNRVRIQVQALYEALRREAIVYAGPPASFSATGQRIRLPGEVLLKRVGTCLDTTILLAACLEAISLHPLVLVVEGHAFLGFWQEDEFFQNIVTDDIAAILKRIAPGVDRMGLVETTDLVAGRSVSFLEAEDHARGHLSKAEEFRVAVDIRRARVGGIRPLPERVLQDGTYALRKTQDLKERLTALPELEEALDLSTLQYERAMDKVSQWERKLLDLSLRNNLINFSRGRRGIDLLAPDLGALSDAFHEGRRFTLLEKLKGEGDAAGADLGPKDLLHRYQDLLQGEFRQGRLRTMLPAKDLEKRLTTLNRNARTYVEESGTSSLFLSLGLLKWYESERSEKERFAPILLLPVDLNRKVGGGSYSVSLRDEDPMLNITLMEKLRQEHHLEIPGLDPLPFTEKGLDTKKILSIVRAALLEKPRWDVVDSVDLAMFSFSKFIMWKDLRSHSEELKRNPVVASLMAGHLTYRPAALEGTEGLLDGRIDPGEILLPTSTDASQLVAVEAAMEGKSFVLHGPPGTGKSQTITSIIANALYQGKRVLFVAEKMAALKVVQQRLVRLGLGPFSLEVHAQKAKKREVLNHLDETIRTVAGSPVDFLPEAERLKTIRKELNAVMTALHRKGPLGRSAYELIGRLGHLAGVRSLGTLPDISVAALDGEGERTLESLAKTLSSLAGVVGPYRDAPLKGLAMDTFRFSLREELEARLPQLMEEAEVLGEGVKDLLERLELPPWETRDGAWSFLESLLFISKDRHGETLRTLLKTPHVLEDLALLREQAAVHEEARAQLLKTMKPEVLTLPLEELKASWKGYAGRSALLTLIPKGRIRKQLALHARSGGKVATQEVEGILQAGSRIQAEEERLRRAARAYAGILPPLGEGEAPSAEALADLEGRLLVLSRHLGGAPGLGEALGETLSPDLVERVLGLEQVFRSFQEGYRAASGLFALELDTIPELSGNWFHRVSDRWDTYLYHLGGLREWTHYNDFKGQAKAAGLHPLVEAFESGRMAGDEAPAVLEKSLAEAALGVLLKEEPLLNTVTGRTLEDNIRAFRAITATYESATAKEIHHRLAAKVPDMLKEAHGSSEVGILQRAIRSGGRGVALRHLFDALPNLLPRIAPCMLMSPMSVAQYLGTGKEHFDLVVFDEASQMPTAEAVGALARGRSAVVVGDPKQLPPTNFFRTGPEEEEDFTLMDLDNILEDCLALSMPETYLLWHYRSRHESLISFSNRTYYGGTLHTYPSPEERRSRVSLEHVPSSYDRGGTRANRSEAEAVVGEILARLKDGAGLTESLGVVTFSQAQQALIEDTLEAALRKEPALEEQLLGLEEPIFVKNLENVQGDERDVILFSIGYGPDEKGNLSHNFGPLNQENGWKRLNVAVTRARKEMKIFTGIAPEMIDPARTTAQGVQDLKAFLQFAERGHHPLDVAEARLRAAGNGLPSLIQKTLEKRGLKSDVFIGRSRFKLDLGVLHPTDKNRYVLGIFTGGPAQRDAKTARDRDILQEDVLKGLGWHMHRVHPVDWMEDPKREVRRIEEALEEALASEKEGADAEVHALEKEKDPISHAGATTVADAKILGHAAPENAAPGRPYTQAALNLPSLSAEEFRMSKNTRLIQDAAKAIVEAEAPLSMEVAVERLLKAFKVRNTLRSREAADQHLMHLGYEMEEVGEVLFLLKEPSELLPYYRLPDKENRRTLRDIHPSELAAAVLDIIDTQISIPKGVLAEEVERLFQLPKGAWDTAPRLEKALEILKAAGRFTMDDGGNCVTHR